MYNYSRKSNKRKNTFALKNVVKECHVLWKKVCKANTLA